jgi:ankyrin repeat protein
VSPNANGKGRQNSVPRQTKHVAILPREHNNKTRDDRWKALNEAIALDDIDAVRASLSQSQQHDMPGLLSLLLKQDSGGRAPLSHAVCRADIDTRLPLEIVRILLDHGADLDQGWRVFLTNRMTTARRIALTSGRDDLVALVKSYAAKTATKHPKR